MSKRHTVCGWPVRHAPTLGEQLLTEAPDIWVRLSDGRITEQHAHTELEQRRSRRPHSP